MTEPSRCPCCGCPSQSPLDLLYREVARIREIAERSDAAGSTRPAPPPAAAAGPADQSAASAARIAELTREIQELRATVARLRGRAIPGNGGLPAADLDGRAAPGLARSG
jgi:hypothetical protein